MSKPRLKRVRRSDRLLPKSVLERARLQFRLVEYQEAHKLFKAAERLARKRRPNYIV